MKLEDLEKVGQATDYFTYFIGKYLFEFANKDEYFKQKLLETDKTLDGCIRYIKSEVKKQVRSGYSMVQDDVVYQQARHYFLEDSINNEDESEDAEETENKEIDLNDQEEASNVEDEQEVKEEAKPRKTTKKAQKTAQDEQPSIFDFEF